MKGGDMKITKEQIENLNQLDRIEYKLDIAEHDKNYSVCYTAWIFWAFVFPLTLMSVLGTLFSSLLEPTMRVVAVNVINEFLLVGCIVLIAACIADCFNAFIGRIDFRKIQAKYFKVSKRR